MTRIISAILACLPLFPAIVLAEGAPRTYSALVNQLVSLMNYAVIVLVALGVAIYFYGMYSNILKFGEDNPEKKKALFFWGIIILFVMVSVWGILRIMQNTFFPGGTQQPLERGQFSA
ncbi:MAG: hypothetical protein Q7S01_00650 [bacterium]|nr:hypothetical protein [bacterium]